MGKFELCTCCCATVSRSREAEGKLTLGYDGLCRRRSCRSGSSGSRGGGGGSSSDLGGRSSVGHVDFWVEEEGEREGERSPFVSLSLFAR